jgi:hypothetical protein
MSIWVIFVDYAAADPAGRWLMQSNETKPGLIWVKFAGCPAAIWDRRSFEQNDETKPNLIWVNFADHAEYRDSTFPMHEWVPPLGSRFQALHRISSHLGLGSSIVVAAPTWGRLLPGIKLHSRSS